MSEEQVPVLSCDSISDCQKRFVGEKGASPERVRLAAKMAGWVQGGYSTTLAVYDYCPDHGWEA